MVKTLTKRDNSQGWVIDQQILESLRTPDTSFELTVDGNTLKISSIGNADRERRFREAMERVNTRYHNVFKRLAE